MKNCTPTIPRLQPFTLENSQEGSSTITTRHADVNRPIITASSGKDYHDNDDYEASCKGNNPNEESN